jgi:dihydrolipoamide dehydrogenase
MSNNHNHNYNYDVLIIGSGPGGYVAAIRAAQLGQKTAVIEKGSLGGVCLNIGCIPTKSIIHQAEIYRNRSKLVAMGVTVDDSGFNYESIFNVSRKTSGGLSKGVAFLLKKNNVEVITGTARLASPHEVVVDGADGTRALTAQAIIVATGSRPKIIPGLEFDGKHILSSDDALMLKELPRKALIIGAGAIGVEFAHIMNTFGVEVHLVEMADRILPLDDGEITAVLTRLFARRGIKVYTSAKVSSHKINGESVEAVIDGADGNQAAISVDKIFVMAGRTPNTDNMGLENLGVSMSNGFVEAGDYYQTGVKSIYAIGDIVASSPLLAHTASAEGEIAAEHIAGHKPRAARIDPMSVPAVVYCEPQTASFGLTEETAVLRNIPFTKATFPYRGCGKAVATDAADGLVKILADPATKQILGAHIIGSDASELVHELLLARNAGIEPAQIATMIHAHPTLSETVMEAARAVGGWAIHA